MYTTLSHPPCHFLVNLQLVSISISIVLVGFFRLRENVAFALTSLPARSSLCFIIETSPGSTG